MPRHLLDIRDLSTQELDDLMDRADDIIQNPKRYAECMHGKKLATLFYEPSTRTRLSFEAAMLELGGSVLGFSSADSSSASKGESVADTVRTVGCYADVIAMRHPKEGAPTAAAQVSPVPIINAATADIIIPRRRWRICSPSAARRDGSTSWSSAAAGTFSSAARCTASSTP